MIYMGSKNRIAKYILPIILKGRKSNQHYVEPFAGGMNTIDKVDGNRIAGDKNKYLIAMWKGLQENRERPYEISRELYSKARTEYNNGTNIEFDDFMIGWVGWMASYNGRFYEGSYSGHNVGKDNRDYISEQIRNTERQIKSIFDLDLTACDYRDLAIPTQSIIYCDIPYKDTTQYATSKNFCHDTFWQWCRDKHKDGHTVYVSEYNAPSDFRCVWQREITNSMHQTNTYKPTEKLFTTAI